MRYARAGSRKATSSSKGLNFQGTGDSGIRIYQPGSGYLIEDCVINGYSDNMDVMCPAGSTLSNVSIRRSVIEYSSGQGKSQGLYAYGITNLLLEGDLFYHNGWSADGTTVPPTIRSHNVYTDAIKNLIAKDNIFADASSFGLTVSGDNTGDTINPLIENNLFVGDGNSLTLGVLQVLPTPSPAERSQEMSSTQIGRIINGVTQAYGIDLGSSRNMTISNNLFLQQVGCWNNLSSFTWATHRVTATSQFRTMWLTTGVMDQSGSTDRIIQERAGHGKRNSGFAVFVGLESSATRRHRTRRLLISNNTYYSNAATSSWFSNDSGATLESFAQWETSFGRDRVCK